MKNYNLSNKINYDRKISTRNLLQFTKKIFHNTLLGQLSRAPAVPGLDRRMSDLPIFNRCAYPSKCLNVIKCWPKMRFVGAASANFMK
jgi:hypothetical protein